MNYLSINSTELKSLPCSIGSLSKLEFLNLGMEKLLYLPDSVGDLTKLRELVLNHSGIRTLPAIIGKLSNSEYLGLCSTKNLVSLPETLTNLKALNYLRYEKL